MNEHPPLPARATPNGPVLHRGILSASRDTPLANLNQSNPYAAALAYAGRG